ncbi:MAG TPA: WD40 repeat domain-containing protein [Gemmataceae bacterium]|nr:WD40 repeat domain-containing protein [Gemmataceae bacterium]
MISGTQRDRLLARLFGRAPLIGGPLRRRALRALLALGQPWAVREVADTVARDPGSWEALRPALLAVRDPLCRDAVCAAWERTRHPGLAELMTAWGHVPATPARLNALVALKLGARGALAAGGAETAQALLDACADGAMAAAARDWLATLTGPGALDWLAARWAECRDEALLAPLRRAGHVPEGPPALHVLTALKLGRAEALTTVGPDGAWALLAACADADADIAGGARPALRQLRNPRAQDAVCQRVIEADDTAAREAALAAGYRPLAPERQALFLFLTGQWEAYDRLDFDRRLLRAAYEGAAEPLRKRIARQARQEGRAELVEVIAGGPDGRRLGRMSADEWAATLDVLERSGAWAQLWQLARSAPPRWAAAVLQRLAPSGWSPPAAERADYEELRALAHGWSPSDFGRAEPCRAVLRDHEGSVDCLAASPDGGLLASGGADGLVRLWRLPAGELLHTLPGHGSPVNCLVFSPDGRALASGGEGTVRLWRLPGGRCRVLHGCTGRVFALALTPDGKTLVSLTRDFAQVWDLTEEEPEGKPVRQSGSLTCLAISPDGEVLATGNEDGRVHLSWHLPDAELQDHLDEHTKAIAGLAFSRDGRTLASASEDGAVLRWEVARGRHTGALPGRWASLTSPHFEPDPHAQMGRWRNPATRLWPLPDGRMLAARVGRSSVRLWPACDGLAHYRLRGHAGHVTCLAAVPAARLLASGGTDGTVRLWGLPTRLARLGQTPRDRLTLADWEWVRSELGREGLPEGERRPLRFLDALLRQRWGSAVHLDETPRRVGGVHDILIEG